MMLAGTLPDPNDFASIGWFCVIAAAVAFGINQVWELVNRAKGKAPHPPNSQLEAGQLELARRVELLEDLHDQFASKKSFDEHTEGNTKRHSEIFGEIRRVETEARERLETRMALLNEERGETLEKLNNQFTFIRENISEIKTELRIRNES
jgi:hypothetical protein